MNKELLNLLESMKKMSDVEDWDESGAQCLIQYGGELYDKYCLQLLRKIDDENKR